MDIERKKLRAFIAMARFFLFLFRIICITTGNYLEIVINEEPLITIFNYVDSHIWLDLIFRFITYYLNVIFVYYAILKKRIYSYKPILLSSLIIIFWLIKNIFQQYEISNYVDILTIGILIIFIPKKWYRVIIGIILTLLFTLISSYLKGISILNYNQILVQNASIGYMFTIDIIIMSIIYYLYSRKEGTLNELLLILRQRKEMENHKYSFRNFTSYCYRCYHYFTRNLRRLYCFWLFAFIVYGSILIISILFNRAIEVTISIIAFHIFRRYDEKTYHAGTYIKCFCVSLISFSIVMKLSLPLQQSILFNIFAGYILSKIMYFIESYIDNKLLVKKYQEKLNNIKTNGLEDLTEEEMIFFMPTIRKDVIHIVYGYLHRPNNKTGQAYALENNICEATLYRYLKLVKNTYENLTK